LRRQPDVSLTGIPRMGRGTVIGALIGAVVVGAIVTTALLVAGAGPGAIVGAAHVGFFGGMGYGGMVGAVVQSARYDRHGRPRSEASSREAPGTTRTKAPRKGVRHAYLHV
jgi:hypothetical protein